jgi:hypothetical protein
LASEQQSTLVGFSSASRALPSGLLRSNPGVIVFAHITTIDQNVESANELQFGLSENRNTRFT